jgi:hypothetical protein
MTKGIDPYYWNLESIAPLTRMLLHELAHTRAIGGGMWFQQVPSFVWAVLVRLMYIEL